MLQNVRSLAQKVSHVDRNKSVRNAGRGIMRRCPRVEKHGMGLVDQRTLAFGDDVKLHGSSNALEPASQDQDRTFTQQRIVRQHGMGIRLVVRRWIVVLWILVRSYFCQAPLSCCPAGMVVHRRSYWILRWLRINAGLSNPAWLL